MHAPPLAPPTLRTLLTLAWPIVLARATQAVVGFCDALMIAPLGEEALAAVTTGAMDLLVLTMLPSGSMFILQSFAAQLRGRGDWVTARRYAVYGLLVAAATGLLTLGALPFIDDAVRLLGYAPRVEEQMTDYLVVRLLSVTAIVGVEALGNWYGGLGNTRMAFAVGLLTMVSNIAGNYLLIEPRFGLPGYGAAGAAWASSLASWLGFALLLVAFLRGVGHEAPSARLTLRRDELVRLLRFGLPSGLNYFLEFAAFALFINVVVGHLGTTVLAAFNVVFQINAISFMPAFGVASAGAILVGDTIGRGQKERVGPIVKLTGWVTCSWMVSVGLVYVLFPELLLGVFRADGDPQATEQLFSIGVTMLALCGVWQLFDALAMTFGEVLRAAGDTAWPMTARVLLAWFVFTPFAWLAVFVWEGGVVTLMLSIIIYIAVLALVLAYRYASGAWKRIELVEGELVVLPPETA